ncbi:hypothetical protein GIB67_012543 [Kingdonia uniflora]|uniref:Uncharacterized protein n=1 Tax=Kingdonia uniflora TaxID=39325 RepID=A0A7J7N5G8_9MAGN|nr:hypothetical protein GIB67_012543 [Kingdonia uniflora]
MAILLTTFMSPSSSSTSIEGGGVYCSMPSGVVTPGWTRLPFDGRRVSDVTASVRNLLFGAVQSHWLSTGHDLCLSRVSVASNYSDSVPHSFSHIGNGGYHPLEELKVSKRCRDTMLTTAEIARTAVEANNNALLVFPGSIHCEPHGHISWAEFQYVIDDYGDIFFEILEDENILRDRGAINPVNVFIGKDILLHGSNMSADIHINDNIPFEDGDFEVVHIEPLEDPLDWGMPDTSRYVHPVYFAKCLTKAINTKYEETMDHPSNRISILGYLRPALVDDESYIRGHFRIDNGDGYSNWKGEPQFEEGDLSTSFPLIDGEIFNLHSEDDGSNISSTLYKLEIIQIELLSVYGVQASCSTYFTS